MTYPTLILFSARWRKGITDRLVYVARRKRWKDISYTVQIHISQEGTSDRLVLYQYQTGRVMDLISVLVNEYLRRARAIWFASLRMRDGLNYAAMISKYGSNCLKFTELEKEFGGRPEDCKILFKSSRSTFDLDTVLNFDLNC